MAEEKQFKLGIVIFVLGLLCLFASIFWPILVLPGAICMIIVPLKFSFPGRIGRGHIDQRFFNLILVVILLAILLPVVGKIRKTFIVDRNKQDVKQQDILKLHPTAEESSNTTSQLQ